MFTSLAAWAAFVTAVSAGWQSPVYPANAFYSKPLPIPPVKQPLYTFTNQKTGEPIDYYEVQVKNFTKQQYPNLPATRFVGYDGIFPGPTFKVTKDRESIVRYINSGGDRDISIHLHGSFSHAPFDGYADDVTKKTQYKDYYYPNRQNARTLWYHDHAVDHTAENVFFGQAGFYIMHDKDELAMGLPQGDYDVPLGIMAHRYNSDGSLWDPEKNKEITSVYGDVIEVNGQPWPYFKVEPRKYRFRLLDLGISRTYQLYLLNQKNQRVPMTVIGSDSGLLAKPVPVQDVTMSIAERWEVIVDFTGLNNQNVTMMNTRGVGADSDFDATDKVMRFVVGNTVTSQAGNGPIPSTLRAVDFPTQNNAVANRNFVFQQSGGEWNINGITWSDAGERLLAGPKRGSIETWVLENKGGGWSHPIHIHLIDFQVIKRENGKRAVLPYESAAQQDVVWLGPNEKVTVIARYAPWAGLYMFHCHNLIHEDHEMLAEFNVTQIAGLNLNETELFINPMDPQYRAVNYDPKDLAARTGPFSQATINAKVDWFTNKGAYYNHQQVEDTLKAYWATKHNKEKRDGAPFGIDAMARRDLLNGWTGLAKRDQIRGASRL